MKTSDLRIGVIGAMGRGALARLAHRPGKGSRVVACCDVREEGRDVCREWYGQEVIFTHDYRELLATPLDAVFVCSPDYLHEEHTVTALSCGCFVYCEKPLAITIRGCDRILRVNQRVGRRLFVGHNMRYMNTFRKMKALIAADAIGDVKSAWCRHFISYGGDAYFRDWHSERRHTTGLLLQKGAHDLDILHWLTGARTVRVAAFGNLAVYGSLPRRSPHELGSSAFNENHWPPLKQSGFSPKIDVEDQNVVILEMEGGVLGAYLQCHFTPDACRNYTLIGTEGRMENYGCREDSPIFIWNRRKDTYRLIGDEVHYGDPVGRGGHGGADPLIVQDFLRFVRTGKSDGASPEDARMAVAVGYQATMSLRQGGRPKPIPPERG